ncbi:MAG TPA: hypothetical protein VG498_19770, partial [Terriglobales bacterium]|nr:hypothetical protein [Terriglobales bacterium]
GGLPSPPLRLRPKTGRPQGGLLSLDPLSFTHSPFATLCIPFLPIHNRNQSWSGLVASRRRLQMTADVGGDRSIVNPVPMGTEQLVSAENDELDESALSALISFFKTLDKWDLEAKRNDKIM